MTQQVGFLYFHQYYHVYHSAPIAYELSLLDAGIQVHLFTASDLCKNLLEGLGDFYPGHRVITHMIEPNWTYRNLNIKRRAFPKPRLMLEKAATELNGMDAIVGTSFETSRLFESFGVNHPKYVFAFHGSGDGAYGFQKKLSTYDLLLLSGEKIKTRLENSGLLSETNYAITGYPKFDATSKLYPQYPALFDNDKTTILYNPHWNRHLSSWYDWGRAILDFFATSDQYNLIFAPHIQLKSWKQRWLSLSKYKKFANIHIDLGSVSSADMRYTYAADMYLGDVSSQVYEFLLTPRPCIFLNNRHIEWSNDPSYVHWNLGDVLDDPSELQNALQRAVSNHAKYKPLQLAARNQTMSQTDTSPGIRAAEAIAKWMSGFTH